MTKFVATAAPTLRSAGICVPGLSVLNLQVAVHAVDFVISHMDLVHFLVLVVLFKSC
jgi:hypothetical protein